MGVLRGSQRLFGETMPETLAEEFKRHADLDRRDAILCIARAIREKGDVRAAVWFLTASGKLLTAAEAQEAGVIGPERSQPTMLPRTLAVVETP